jgi:hypothetical protein
MRRFWIPSTIFLLMASTATAQSYAHCEKIISSGLREYNVSTDSEAYLNTVFDRYCESSGSAKSASAGIGVEFPIKAVPLRFSGNYSSAEEGHRNFCKTYSSYTSSSRSTYSYTERIVEKAYDAFDKCVELTNAGVQISHEQVSRAAISINLKAAQGTTLEVRGLKPSKGISCSGQQPDGTLTQYGESTHGSTRDFLKINCERSGRDRPDGSVMFDEGSIQLATNTNPGGYDIFWPADILLTERSASEIAARLTAFDNALKTKLSNDEWPSGSYVILRGSATCPAGFKQVDSFIHAIASFYDPAQNPQGYISEAHFGASALACHGKCSQYARDSPYNIQWLGDLSLSVCVK